MVPLGPAVLGSAVPLDTGRAGQAVKPVVRGRPGT
jgi:hypothetical protein